MLGTVSNVQPDRRRSEMGEYARYRGESVKIGTCEDMYYLRADQAHLVTPEYGNVNPMDKREREVIRFRFPFPDEDGIEPGAFDRYDRAIGLYGVEVPDGVEHGTVQFVASAGFNVCLPCPESVEGKALPWKVHRNGYPGPVQIVQQAYRDGLLVVIGQCGGCHYPYRYPTLADAEPIILACRSYGDREANRDPSRARWWHTVAHRIAAGYLAPVGAR